MNATEMREQLRSIVFLVIERNEGQTGLGVGPQAAKLADDLLDVLQVEGGRLTELHDLEVAERESPPDPAMTVERSGPRLALDFRVSSADMAAVLAVFDQTAPRLHGQLARELLFDARAEGAAGDVVEYLALMADADVVEGVYTVVWPEDKGLPAPGSQVLLGEQFPEPVRGKVQIVGFGRNEGSLRVRPVAPVLEDPLGPPDAPGDEPDGSDPSPSLDEDPHELVPD